MKKFALGFAVLILLVVGITLLAQTITGQPITFQFYQLDETLAETGLDPNCLGKDEAFLPYGDVLSVHCDEEFMYIESFSFADHTMMVGIVAWNGQVPVPQPITGDNSWRIRMNPTLTGSNTATVGQGPIAVAVNGVMIFNPTQQDGVYAEDHDPFLIGELDVCGGHSGRGDDYHYHIAPVCIIEHLAEDSDGTLPIAYALDGFPIYGFTNPDGSIPELDECNGQFDENGAYHYHATEEYPYINGCFKGEFTTQIQPVPHPIREAQTGGPSHVLITDLYQDDEGWIHMEYEYEGKLLAIIYREVDESCFEYQFVSDVATGASTTEIHCRADEPPQGQPEPGQGPPPNGQNQPPGTPPPTPG